MSQARKWVYTFSKGKAEGNLSMKEILGGKGAGLAEMSSLGLNVPPGFTVSTELCEEYARVGAIPEEVYRAVDSALEWLEAQTHSRFGKSVGGARPLLISVRSGAAVSMPGMMDTILNVGLCPATIAELVASSPNPRWVWDSYRRLIDLYGEVVAGIPHAAFEAELQAAKTACGAVNDVDLTTAQLQALVDAYLAAFAKHTGAPFPSDPRVILRESILGVVKSWNNPRAVKYRELNKISGLKGTAVTIQLMCFGNSGPRSGTGVLFTRNPSTGENVLYGEFLTEAQGEDVVAGIRTPQPIAQLKSVMPTIYDSLYSEVKRLERHCRCIQDVEFTVDDGVLYILQCRDGKRTGSAALRIATEMVTEGLVSKSYAVSKLVTAAHLTQLMFPTFKPSSAAVGAAAGGAAGGAAAAAAAAAALTPIMKGLPASPGAAVGRVVFSAADAEAWKARGERVILVRPETSAEDVGGMHSAEAVVTQHGGMTSHAAVVARGWGRPCVVGCNDLVINAAERTFASKTAPPGTLVKEGDYVSVNGTTGEVFLGACELMQPAVSSELSTFLSWARALCDVGVRVNADSGKDVDTAYQYPIDGVGLVRTEHMFWGEPRIKYLRELILATSVVEREAACAKLLPHQQGDFEGIFRALLTARAKWDAFRATAARADNAAAAAHGCPTAARDGAVDSPAAAAAAPYRLIPVTVRTLDPPLHEYLPLEPEGQAAVASDLHISVERVASLVSSMRNMNPLIGFRGCRVGITHPEIVAMQVKAVLTAAVIVTREAAAAGVLPASGAAATATAATALAGSTPTTIARGGSNSALGQLQQSQQHQQPQYFEVEIMLPMTSTLAEVNNQKLVVDAAAAAVFAELGATVPYRLGTMVETPRACLRAGELAADACKFFSFGSNDLTATTWGYSRDDAPKWLHRYLELNILRDDPFASLDTAGVGELLQIAIARGRKANPALEIGLCGEHGGHEESVGWLVRETEIDYVSCSPFRLPIAILAGAQASIAMAAAVGGGGAAQRHSSKPRQ